MHNFYICFFVKSTNVIDLTTLSLLQYGSDSATMIADVKPVTNLEAVTINWQGFVS